MATKILNKVNIENRRAKFDYQFIEQLTAGMVLTGTEIKSIREGKAALVDSYCYFRNDALYIKNLNITEYSKGTHYNHEPNRERKLLLTKAELNKLQKKLNDQGLTIVPVRFFVSESGYAKLDIALAKGKKAFDKRESIKREEVKRRLKRVKLY